MANSFNARWSAGDVLTAVELNKVGLVFVGDTTLAVDTADISVASIPSGYAHLLIVASLRNSGATNNPQAKMRFNDDTGANYVDANGSTETSAHIGYMTEDDITPDANAVQVVVVPFYASTTVKKTFLSASAARFGITTADQAVYSGAWNPGSVAAITKVTMLPGVNSLNAGSRLTVYGMND